jgi:ubiquinone/menaquinone biosynthesis C-methylase UbiE
MQSFTKFELKKRKENVFDLILKQLSMVNGNALDLGCGAGHYLTELTDLGFNAVGADISNEMLLISSSKLSNLSHEDKKLVCADCYNVPLPAKYFDLIICIGVLEYLDKETSALTEIKRLLKPDGNVIITVPNFFKLRNLVNPYYYLIRIWTYLFGKKSAGTHKNDEYNKNVTINFGKSTVSRYSLTKINKIVRNSGFRITEVRSYCFGPFSIWKKGLFSLEKSIRISNFFESLLDYKTFGILKFFANRWVLHIKP